MTHFIPCFLNSHSPQIKLVYFHTFHSFFPSSTLPAHYAYASTPYLSIIHFCFSCKFPAFYFLLSSLLSWPYICPIYRVSSLFQPSFLPSFSSFFLPSVSFIFSSFQLDISEFRHISRLPFFYVFLLSLFSLCLLHFFCPT